MASKIDRVGETRVMKCGMKATIVRYGKYSDIDVRFEDGAVVKHKDYGKFKKGNIAHPNTTAEDRLGETRMMKCGMKATIVRYGRSDDIDVRFEDGTVVEHRRYGSFKKGGIANQNTKASAEDRLGETRMMNCGMEATIIRYRNAGDIDVRFEDGTVTKHKKYYTFKKRQIASQNIKASAENRLGETRMMNCGMKATIIRYENYKDIDVRFEDGDVVENKTYGNFKKGEIANPNTKASAENCLGETRMMNCGMEATIIRYGNSTDIDVRFEDDAIIKHRQYCQFKRGKIANPNTKASAENRLGETRMMSCRMEATIIRYGGCDDIDVRFEDGAVVENRTYREFKNGEIINPNTKVSAEDRLGETRMMNCGMKATIVRYGRHEDIDVRFEDGVVVEHKAYGNFKRGVIANPNMKASAETRLGETRMMNCGMEATIIRYGGATDVDVRFEDGTVAVHKTYNAFKEGGIAHPSTTAEARLGETRMMNCGMEATIIRYGGSTDIDVCFENGIMIEHKAYDNFKRGVIANPNFNPHLGETRMMNCGMEATIIRYGRSDDIDIRFEDGTMIEHKIYDNFKRGVIAHQSLSLKHGSKDFHGFICKRGFIDEGRTLYECICKHCGLEDVLTPQEMMEHEKLKHRENK